MCVLYGSVLVSRSQTLFRAGRYRLQYKRPLSETRSVQLHPPVLYQPYGCLTQ